MAPPNTPSFLTKVKNRFSATRFEYALHVHMLQPWPAGNRAIAIGWQRGKKRRGATEPTYPMPSTGNLATSVRFNEKITLPATLYKAVGADKNAVLGPYKKKSIILAILETDARSNSTTVLGRVVIDLSDFVSIDGQELRTFPIACNKSITAAVGEPQLTLTIRCRWKKSGAEMTDDEVASMSTDTTGSNMTSTMANFLRFKYNAAKPVEKAAPSHESEQDLRGFDNNQRYMDQMETIQEDHDHHDQQQARLREEDGISYASSPRSMDTPLAGALAGDHHFARDGPTGSGGLQVSPPASVHSASHSEIGTPSDYQVSEDYGRHSPEGRMFGGGLGAAGGVAQTPYQQQVMAAARQAPPPAVPSPSVLQQLHQQQQQQQQQQQMPAFTLRSLSEALPSSSQPQYNQQPYIQMQYSQQYMPPPSPQPAVGALSAAATAAGPLSSGRSRWRVESVGSVARRPSPTPPAPGVMMQRYPVEMRDAVTETDPAEFELETGPYDDGPGGGGGDGNLDQLQDELLTAAAVDCAIWAPQRSLAPSKNMPRRVHAPARRIARTVLSLGRADGIPFGRMALKIVETLVINNRTDLNHLAFWWTNMVHLRGFLQSLNLTVTQDNGQAELTKVHWSAKSMVPMLHRMEKFIFQELVSHMWSDVMVPIIAAPAASGGQRRAVRSGHEGQIRKWLEGLEAVNEQLKRLGSEGHISMLRHQALLQVLKRVDNLLFYYLLSGAGQSTPSTPSSSTDRGSVSLNARITAAPPLAPRTGLPSAMSAPLSNRNGMNMSMPVSEDSEAAEGGEGGEQGDLPIRFGVPRIDEALLPFMPRQLSFGVGMNLKVAVTRFQQWAFGEGDLRRVWASLPAQGQTLFPYLRACGDLLMMPKSLLRDDSIREDLLAALSLPSLLFIVERYQPDEFSAEAVERDVLRSLYQQAIAAGHDTARPPQVEVETESTYYSPPDDMTMVQVEEGIEPGLEYDADSEDELERVGTLNSLVTGRRGEELQAPLRYKLLHNLWASHVPRQRRIVITHPEEVEDQ